jgi:hypothetical protein
MQLRFDVGDQKRHEVVFSFNKTTGWLVIKVDDVPIKRQLIVWSISLHRRWELTVGSQERHFVAIEKERKRVASFARPQVCRAYVDGTLVAEGTA